MNNKTFNEILERRLAITREILQKKATEYARNDAVLGYDRLHNFNRASQMLGGSREKALIGMLAKHLVSVLDMVDSFGKEDLPTTSFIDEKIGDSINYLILLEAMLKEDSGRVKSAIDIVREELTKELDKLTEDIKADKLSYKNRKITLKARKK